MAGNRFSFNIYFISHSNAVIQYNTIKHSKKRQQDTVKTVNIKINGKICTYKMTVNSEQYNQWTKKPSKSFVI